MQITLVGAHKLPAVQGSVSGAHVHWNKGALGTHGSPPRMWGRWRAMWQQPSVCASNDAGVL